MTAHKTTDHQHKKSFQQQSIRIENVTLLVAVLLAACVAFQLNASMLSPVLVTMARELNTTETMVGLSQTAFFTSAALFSLFLPRLSDIKGRKKVLVWMLSVMAMGTIIAAIAPNIVVLSIARIIQGVSGPVVALCLLMLRHEIKDPTKLGFLMGLIAAVNGGIAGIDAMAGGVIATHYGFRMVFWVIVAVAVLAVIMVAKWAPESKPSASTKMDWLGTFWIVLSLAGLLLALNEASQFKNANWLFVIGLIIASIIFFWLFWQTEKRIAQPLVTTHYLKQRSTWALLLTTVLTMTGIFAVVNGLVMSYAQNQAVGFGLEAQWSSLILLTPYALVGWLVGPFAGRFAPVIGYNNILRIGLSGSVISIALMIFYGLNSLPILVTATILIGFFYAGIGNIILNNLGIVLSPSDNPGFLPGMNAGAFNLGAGLSFALLPAIQGVSLIEKQGYINGMTLGLLITLLALLTTFLIPKPVGAEVNS